MPWVPNNKKRSDGVTGPVDASDVTYTPVDESNWGGADPGNVDDALDDLAECCTTNSDIIDQLVPPNAPSLDDIEEELGSNGVAGNLSFGSANAIAGYQNHPTYDVDDLMPNTGDELGIYGSDTVIVATLNDDVAAEANGAYPADAFSPGNEGTLQLLIDVAGVETVIHSVDLSTFGSGLSQNGNGSGFSLSASTPVEFPNGSTFPSRQYRTGLIVVASTENQDGYNKVLVKHITSDGTNTTNAIEWIVDNVDTATSFNTGTFSSLNTSGSKHLSGVEYHTSISATYNITISNAYRNTYSDSGSAITHPTNDNCSISSSAIPILQPDDESDTIVLAKTCTLDQTRVIRNVVGQSSQYGFRVSTRVDRTVQTDSTSANASDYEFCFDNASANSTDLDHTFNDEAYRIPSNANFNNDLSSTWDETISLVSATAGYSDGIQTINGGLDYPEENFGTIADGPAGNPDYSSASGSRTYYGYFTNSTATGNFRLTVQGTATLIAETTSFTNGTNQVKISLKWPNYDSGSSDSGTGTGWLDVTQAFIQGNWADGDGCYSASLGNDQTIPTTNLGVTIGTRSSADSYDKVYYRITVPQGWTGEITRVAITWNAS